MSSPAQAIPHTLFEDAQALLIGTLLVAMSVVFVRQAGLLTGGTAGLAFLLHYLSGWRFGLVFFLINLPFYAFAVRALGWRFTLKTFAAVALLSGYSEVLPQLLHIDQLNTAFAAVIGGLLAGVGLLMLIRHKASLGGIGVMAIYLQEKRGLRAGKVQLWADVAIVLSAIFVVDATHVLLSVLGAAALNLVIAVNHRPGRYVGF